MESRAAVALTAVAVGVLAASVGRGSVPAGGRTDVRSLVQDTADHAPSTEVGSSPGRRLLGEFFGVHDEFTHPSPYEFDVLIATLPDPIDTHLDWEYDAQLQALRLAFETAGYVIDRFWIPSARDSVSITVDGERRELPQREGVPGVVLFRYREPDVLSLRLLYLVPEVPTGGIYRQAMLKALDERRELLTYDANATGLALEAASLDSARKVLRIIGPTFSGSALSLRLLLLHEFTPHDTAQQPELHARLDADADAKEHLEPPERAMVISGSATSMSNLGTLDSLVCDSPCEITFRATVNPDESLTAALGSLVLSKLGISPAQVAVFKESSTQYGAALLGQGRAASDSMCSASSFADSVGVPTDCFLVIPFPMSISSLRTEYMKTPVPAEAGTMPTLPLSQPRLPLDLLDPLRPKVDLPVTSRLSAPSIDLIFDELARTLQRRDIRLVGLLATDVRDKLFLAEELRRRVRDLQFFTYESSVLYLRPDRRSSLGGMLVLSSYPLQVETQEWAQHGDEEHDPGRQRFAFASDAAQGVYNATLLQLGSDSALLDYEGWVGAGVHTRRPPVWLSTVGNGVFLPVAGLACTEASEKYAYRPFDLDGHDHCPSATTGDSPAIVSRLHVGFLPLAGMVVSTFVLAIFAIGALRGNRRERRRLSTEGPVELARDAKELRDQVRDGSLRLHEQLYCMLRLLAVGGVWLAVSGPLYPVARARLSIGAGSTASDPTLPLAGAALLVFALGAALLGVAAIVTCTVTASRIGFRYCGAWRSYFNQLRWRLGAPASQSAVLWFGEIAGRAAVIGLGVVFFVFTARFAGDIITTLRPFHLFYLRATEVSSLVSPVLPLILGGVGFGVWSTWHLTRIRWLERETAFGRACADLCTPTRNGANSTLNGFRARFRRAGAACREGWSHLFLLFPSTSAFVLLLFVTLAFAWLWPVFGRTLESIIFPSCGPLTCFDWLLRLVILAAILSILWAVLRLWLVWRSLQWCLDELSGLPLLSAFERLPPELVRVAQLSLPGKAAVVGVGALAVRQWQHLRRIHDAARQAIADDPGAAHVSPGIAALMADANVYPRDAATGRLPDQLARRLRDLQEILGDLWSQEPTDEEVKQLAEEFAKPDTATRGPAASVSGRLRRSFRGEVRLWLRAAEEYFATEVVGYAEWVVSNLRVLSLFLFLALLLTMALLSSYPFPAQGLVRLAFFFVLLVTVGVMLVVLAQMNRNAVLSRIAQQEPGKITWNAGFVANLMIFAVVPLVTLLGSEFAPLRNFLFSWAEPLIRGLARY